jgi:cellulose synthase/poly-beta-1,6-N-acetylglucosamine synthase-like glycosyltransferase
MGQNWRPDEGVTREDGRQVLLLEALVQSQAVPAATAPALLTRARSRGVPLSHVLEIVGGVSQGQIAAALATLFQARQIDPLSHPPDPRLIARTPAADAIAQSYLPWRKMGGATIILTADPDRFASHLDRLSKIYGPVRMAITTRDQPAAAQTRAFASRLVQQAEVKVPAQDSCRTWNRSTAAMVSAVVLLFAVAGYHFAPVASLALLCGICVVTMLAQTGLKAAALVASTRVPPRRTDGQVMPARLPRITMLIPLYDETAIAAHLLRHLHAIDYPLELLDICFVMEAGDLKTRRAIGNAKLARWMRHVTVPAGTVKTKPRALNYALNFTDSDIIGVWDAEDAPEPDQLLRVAQRFAEADEGLACLQGVLDYYNPRANWLTRCFALEYAAWFRVVLPGLARMGLIVPLGGTTLFFRRATLDRLDGWDAHNVTEDADLGIRLARRGYRTELIDTVTFEEANGHAWPWIKQRSRWLKGYAMTYGVHMRSPLRLWRDVGAWRFFGLQVLILGTVVQSALALVVWSFWLVPLGLPHPVADGLPAGVLVTAAVLFAATGLLNLAVAALGVNRAGKRWLLPWALTLPFYFPLAMIAMWKGLFELCWKPFFWDKTAHGKLLPRMDLRATASPLLARHPVSDG